MDEYADITEAARQRDWQSAAKVMFMLLYKCSARQQYHIAITALSRYVEIWTKKHEKSWAVTLKEFLMSPTIGRHSKLPEFPDNLDPADAEFENGLIEFYSGSDFKNDHAQRTIHLATAIRSSVLAKQIEQWRLDYPEECAKWKAGQWLEGPTFLEDELAAKEAIKAWIFVDEQLKAQRTFKWRYRLKGYWSANKVARLYKRWEELVL
jgi:hypothetical protein